MKNIFKRLRVAPIVPFKWAWIPLLLFVGGVLTMTEMGPDTGPFAALFVIPLVTLFSLGFLVNSVYFKFVVEGK